EVQQLTVAAGHERQEIGERIAEEVGEQCDDQRDLERAEQGVEVQRVGQKADIIVDIQVRNNGITLLLPKAVLKHIDIGQYHEKEQVKAGWPETQHEVQAAAPRIGATGGARSVCRFSCLAGAHDGSISKDQERVGRNLQEKPGSRTEGAIVDQQVFRRVF